MITGPDPCDRAHPSSRARRPLAVVLVSLILAAASAIHPAEALGQDSYDVPYVPSPDQVVNEMLALLAPQPGDTVYDLGSGDGRIVIAAARRRGAHGVGVEIDSGRVDLARENAEAAGVDSLVRFIHADLFDTDVSAATMVTLYLLPDVNRRLRPKLFRELRPGTPVVSHDFDMGEWEADSTVTVPDDGSSVYYWIMPANASGTWELAVAGERLTLAIDQRYQELSAGLPGRAGVRVVSAALRGSEITLELEASEGTSLDGRVLSGSVEGDRMFGTDDAGREWWAHRTAGGGPVAGGR